MNKIIQLIKVKLRELKSKGAFHVVVGSFMTKFAAFFGSIFIVRLLSKSDYGVLSYYENFASYFTVLAGCGLAPGLLRYMVIARDMPEKKSCFAHAVKRGTIWNVVLVAVGLAVIYFYPHPESFQGYFRVGAMLILCVPFVYLLEAGLCSFRGLFDNKIYAVIAFSTSAFLIIARIIGAALGGLNLTTVMRFAAEIVCAAVCVALLYYRYFRSEQSSVLSRDFIREMDIFSLQMMFTNGLWAIFMLNDVFLIGQISGNETVLADYKIAYVIPANLSILISAVGIFVAPYFTKYEHAGNYAWIRAKYKVVLKVTMAIMGVAVALCFLLAKPLILLLYGEAYLTSVPIMRMLLVASFFNNGIRSTTANILSATGVQKMNLIVAAGGMVLQIVLDVLLIPRYGGMGVAVSSSIVYLSMSIALVIVFYKKYFAGNPSTVKEG